MTLITTSFLLAVSLLAQLCGSSGWTGISGATTSATTAAAPAAPSGDGSAPLVAPQHPPGADVDFKAVLDLQQAPVGNEPQLRGGRIAVSKEWPASLYATFNTPDGRAACTAALIGPQAMLTAAHCMPSSGRVTFTYTGQSYATSCTQHPQYANRQDPSADYALCKVDRRFAEPAGFRYETVDASSMTALAGATLILTGYGCVSDIVANNPTDGKYRIGFNTVDETSASTTRRRGAALYAGSEDNNLFTTDDPAMANLCPGDSGGPAFRRTGGSDQFSSRVIVGINSRVFYKDARRTSYGSSLVSATGGPEFGSWAEEWARRVARVDACGLNGAIPNCRS